MSNLDKNSEGGRKALDMGDCSINISDGSELELTLSKKISSYFESNFQIFLFSCISKTSILKVHDVLHWINVLVMKTFSKNAKYILYPNILYFVNKSYLH